MIATNSRKYLTNISTVMMDNNKSINVYYLQIYCKKKKAACKTRTGTEADLFHER